MKFNKAIAAVAAAFALMSFVGVAGAQEVSGAVVGRWSNARPNVIVSHANMQSLRGDTMYAVEMTLRGRDSGTVAGTIASVPRPGVPQYVLAGSFVRGTDGRIHVTAKIALYIGPLDAQVPHVVGTFNCILDRNPGVNEYEVVDVNGNVPPTTPWKRVFNGHVHGRWTMRVTN